MNTSMTAWEARAESGHQAVILAFADGEHTVQVSVPTAVAVRLGHQLAQAIKETNGFRPAPSGAAA